MEHLTLHITCLLASELHENFPIVVGITAEITFSIRGKKFVDDKLLLEFEEKKRCHMCRTEPMYDLYITFISNTR